MKIVPLTYSICNWNGFASLFNAVKPNATQGVQRETDFGKVAETIGKLKSAPADFSMFHLTFGVECDRKLLNYLYDTQSFNIQSFDCEDCLLILINASVQDWKQACLDNCVIIKPKYVRQFFNQIFLLLEQAAVDSVIEWHKVPFEDQTFGFKRRF